MGFNIEIVTVEKIKDKYDFAEVEYTYKGKMSSKRLALFGNNKGIAQTMMQASSGETWNIETAKNDKGYTDWVKATKVEGNDSNDSDTAPRVGSYAGRAAPTTGRTPNTYETPEERARKQLYIVRQSSLSAAVDILKVRGTSFGRDEVIAEAEELVAWVMADPVKDLHEGD